jgi:hypothetical protein
MKNNERRGKMKITIITFVWALFVTLLMAWLLMEIVR